MKDTPALRILQRPIAEWPQAINSTRASLQEIESDLSALTQRAALLTAYLGHRYNTGCGDQGHEASAKKANRCLVAVRRALGFSYPQNVGMSV